MVAKKTAGSTAKKAVAKPAAAEDEAPAEQVTAARKTAARKTAARKTAAAKKADGGTGSAGKRKAAAGKTAAGKAPAEKAAAEGAAHAAKTTGARTVVAKKSTGTARKTATAATSGLPKAKAAAVTVPGELAVRPGEEPWTREEVEEARSGLMAEALRLRAELDASEAAISGLMRDSGDGAGDDQADTGTKNITRESELALAANASSMLEQTERALERLEAGTYGLCENCGKPIGKARMQAFPRATLCVDCKQKQERRH
ncbi:TraR/DksA family transcriptional regulator [Streptomyces subrutilus]|uniref:TraR/DksA family transcriptional regulator n=1 Tax=Streptomyces subrutilus TaxID=36818 RepID=UPI002E149CC7|nr:TraR/DksA C4-type zinc finger protein [Streptomyces subrutilus]